MRNLRKLDHYRCMDPWVLKHYGFFGDDTCGVFMVPSPIDAAPMCVIAAVGMGWDHVSVSRPNRCPNWPEMSYVNRAFFLEDEVAMELHVAESEHINVHEHCLHLWRPIDGRVIPMPPSIMVGPSEGGGRG
jgi:hypothetical protein